MPKITWMQDGAGVYSIHVNGAQSMKDSYLGHLTMKRGEDGKEQWFFHQRGVETPHGPYDNMNRARIAAVKLVDGEYV